MAAGLLHGAGAQAEGQGHFAGFGSLAFSHDDGRDIALLRDTSQPVSEGRDSSLRSDSILGLQAGYRFSPVFEVASQVVLRHRVDYKPKSVIELAYAAWHPSERLDVRVGRVGLDVFMLSDYRSVGYAQPWVRPPREFYGWIPLHSIDGADAAWKFEAGGMRWTAKAQVGRSSVRVPLDDEEDFVFRADRLRDFTLHAERGAWQFKLGHLAFRLGSEPAFGPLRAALNSVAAGPFGPISDEAASLAGDVELKGTDVRYTSLGAAYDDGRWQIQGELARVSADSKVMPTGTAAYVSAAYRIGAFTPYAVVARFRPERDGRKRINDWSGLGAAGVELQTQAVAAFNNYRIDQRTLSLGMRWDFASRAALKMQWDRSFMKARGYGLWQVNNLVSGEQKRKVDVLTLSLDFVF